MIQSAYAWTIAHIALVEAFIVANAALFGALLQIAAAFAEAYKRLVPAATQAAYPRLTHAASATRAVTPNVVGFLVAIVGVITGKKPLPAFLREQAEAVAKAAGTTPEKGAQAIANAVAQGIDDAANRTPLDGPKSVPSLPAVVISSTEEVAK